MLLNEFVLYGCIKIFYIKPLRTIDLQMSVQLDENSGFVSGSNLNFYVVVGSDWV